MTALVRKISLPINHPFIFILKPKAQTYLLSQQDCFTSSKYTSIQKFQGMTVPHKETNHKFLALAAAVLTSRFGDPVPKLRL